MNAPGLSKCRPYLFYIRFTTTQSKTHICLHTINRFTLGDSENLVDEVENEHAEHVGNSLDINSFLECRATRPSNDLDK